MQEKKESFVFYIEYKEAIDQLNNKNKLEFYECITEYAFYGNIPSNVSKEVKSLFVLIKSKLDKNNTSYWNFEDRRSSRYKIWKKSVLERDKYTCQKCGNKSNLIVHHIKPFASNKELRFDISNGVTLCQKCHKEVHKKNER